jgi:hypothetical protein
MRNPGRDFIIFSLLFVALSTACAPGSANAPGMAEVLLFTGAGTSQDDVASIETILNGSHISYSLVSSVQLNEMARSELSK